MTRAEIERGGPDPYAANAFLGRAKQFASDGGTTQLSPEGRQLLLHAAVVAACDALLAIEGRSVVGADGGHQLRLDEAQRLLPGGHVNLFDRLEEARGSRNRASYSAAPVPVPDVIEASAMVGELVVIVNAYVGPRLPEWMSAT